MMTHFQAFTIRMLGERHPTFRTQLWDRGKGDHIIRVDVGGCAGCLSPEETRRLAAGLCRLADEAEIHRGVRKTS